MGHRGRKGVGGERKEEKAENKEAVISFRVHRAGTTSAF